MRNRYHYRLADRWGLPVTSLAVLADPDPAFRPVRHLESAPGTRVVFDFSAVKLLDFKTEPQPLNDLRGCHKTSGRKQHIRASAAVRRVLLQALSPFAVAGLIQLRKLRIGSAPEPVGALPLCWSQQCGARARQSFIVPLRRLYLLLTWPQ